MNLKLRISPAAEVDAEEASDYYSIESPGLDRLFIAEIHRTLARIVVTPLAFPVIFGSEIRSVQVDRFPFSILFSLRKDHVWVFSVFHNSRNPMIWRGRID